MTDTEKLAGSCYCEGLRHEATKSFVRRGAYDCRACQYVSGGGRNLFVLVRPSGFRFTLAIPGHTGNWVWLMA